MVDYKLFQVGEDYAEYIIAQTAEEALAEHNDRVGDEYKLTIDDVTEKDLDAPRRFETENGYEDMTFREFLGEFVYKKPTLVCWNE